MMKKIILVISLLIINITNFFYYFMQNDLVYESYYYYIDSNKNVQKVLIGGYCEDDLFYVEKKEDNFFGEKHESYLTINENVAYSCDVAKTKIEESPNFLHGFIDFDEFSPYPLLSSEITRHSKTLINFNFSYLNTAWCVEDQVFVLLYNISLNQNKSKTPEPYLINLTCSEVQELVKNK